MSENTITKPKVPSYQFWAFFLIILGVIIGSLFIYLVINNNVSNIKSDIDMSKTGQFGDFIGGVIGSIWALAGVFLFFQALKEQRQDIETNINLLQLQIEGLDSTKLTAEQQSNILRIQRIENTYFTLFKTFTEITDNLEISHTVTDNSVSEIIKGKKVFSIIAKKLYDNTEESSAQFVFMHASALLAYERIYEEFREVLQPYFGVLYNTLKFIDNANLEISEKYTYSNILRGYLTNSELVILYYHWTRYSEYDFKNLFKKFNLLKNLSIESLPELKVHKKNLDRILKNDKQVNQPNLSWISRNISNLLKEEFFNRESSFDQVLMSGVSIWVTIKEANLEVQIKVPTAKFRKQLLSPMKASPYAKTLNELRKFDFCGLIEALIYSIMVNNNFFKYLSQDPFKLIYLIKRDIYDTQDGNYKVFKCTFTYEDTANLIPPMDIDELESIIQLAMRNESETVNSENE